MKIYKCDACGKDIISPHSVRMKEFYIGCHFENFGVISNKSHIVKKIHIYDDCYRGLYLIGKCVSNKK